MTALIGIILAVLGPNIEFVSLFAFLASCGAAGFCVISLVYVVEISGKRFMILIPTAFYIARSLSFIMISIMTFYIPNIFVIIFILSAIPLFMLVTDLRDM